MNQAFTFKVFADGALVAEAEETGLASGFPSMTFRNMTTGLEIASSILKDRNFHGKYDEWLVNNPKDLQLPFYVTSAATLLLADVLGHQKLKDEAVATAAQKAEEAKRHPNNFMALPESSSLESVVNLESVSEVQHEVPVALNSELEKKQATISTEHV